MRLALKIGIGLVVVLAVAASGVFGALFLGAAKPDQPVGFDEVSVNDPHDRPLAVGIWYPTAAKPGLRLVGFSAQRVADDGTVVGSELPLIIISHGNGGLLSSHADTALALAAAGFVVAAVTHTGDNAQDQRYVGTTRWLVDRSRHIRLVLDYMLNDWRAHEQLDSARIGMFGFSAGGFTALVAIGGDPDLARIGTQCRARPEFACTLWPQLPSSPAPAAAWVHDPRIKAAVIAAPGYGFAFEPNGLARVTAAVQLWNGADDTNVPYQSNAAVVRELMPVPPEYHVIPGAAHFAFLAPCPAWIFPLVCADAKGFDRAAFHRDFNRSVIAFYQRQLPAK